jgi:hypothetical protein
MPKYTPDWARLTPTDSRKKMSRHFFPRRACFFPAPRVFFSRVSRGFFPRRAWFFTKPQ